MFSHSGSAHKVLGIAVVSSLAGVPVFAVSAHAHEESSPAEGAQSSAPVIERKITEVAPEGTVEEALDAAQSAGASEDQPQSTPEPTLDERIEAAAQSHTIARQELDTVEATHASVEETLNKAQAATTAATQGVADAQAEKAAADANVRSTYAAEQAKAQETVSALEKEKTLAEQRLTEARQAHEAAAAEEGQRREESLVAERAAQESQASADAIPSDEYAKAEQDVADAEQRVATTAAESEAAASALSAAQEALAAADAEHAAAQSRVDEASAAASDAAAETQRAQADLDAKTQAYEALKAEGFTEGDIEQAEQELRAAEQQLAQAQAAEAELAQTLAAQEAEAARLASAREALAAESQAAHAALTTAQGEAQAAQQALESATAQLAAARQAASEAQATADAKAQAESSAQSALASANRALDAARRTVEERARAVDAAQAALAIAEEEHRVAAARFAEGAFGFFQDRIDNGATQTERESAARALAVLNTEVSQNGLKTETEKGDLKDATSLDNMKIALDGVDATNRLRERGNEGGAELRPLMVSDELMAIAQWQTNWSITNNRHSSAFPGVAENLAWGYRNVDEAFAAWYDDEKVIYDAEAAKGTDMEVWADPFTPEGHKNFEVVGHYLNLIQEHYAVTGFAFASRTEFTWGQTFTWRKTGQLFTAEEYRARFMEYYNKVNPEAARQRLARAQENLRKAKAAHSAAVKDVSTKHNRVTKLQADLAKARRANTDAKRTLAGAQQNVVRKEQALASAQATHTARQHKLNAAHKKVTQTQNKINVTTTKIAEQNKRVSATRQNLQQARSAVAGAQRTVDAKRQKVADISSSSAFFKARRAWQQAKAELAKAQAQQATRDKALRNARAALTSARNQAVTRRQEHEAAQRRAAETARAHVQAQADLLQARAVLAPMRAKVEAAQNAQSAFRRARASHDASHRAVEERFALIGEMEKTLANVTDMLTQARAHRELLMTVTLEQVYAGVDATVFPVFAQAHARLVAAQAAVSAAQELLESRQGELRVAQARHSESLAAVEKARAAFASIDSVYKQLLGERALRDARSVPVVLPVSTPAGGHTQDDDNADTTTGDNTHQGLASTGATLHSLLATAGAAAALYSVSVLAGRRRRD